MKIKDTITLETRNLPVLYTVTRNGNYLDTDYRDSGLLSMTLLFACRKPCEAIISKLRARDGIDGKKNNYRIVTITVEYETCE